MVWAPHGESSSYLVILLDPHTLRRLSLYQIFLSMQLLNCDFVVLSFHVTSFTCLPVLGERFLLCGSSRGFSSARQVSSHSN